MNAARRKDTARPAALVTGSAVRVGRAIAEALGEAGYDLALHYCQSRSQAEDLATQLRQSGRTCELVPADLTDVGQTSTLIADVKKRFAGLNLLVNSASIFEDASLRQTEADLFDRHFNLNFKAPFCLTRDFANQVGQGHIINILDQRVRQVRTDYVAYTLSKKALADFTLLAAKELAPDIRVNGIAPGYILPPVGTGPAATDRISGKIPLQRQGTLDNMVCALKYLIKNPFVTGDILYVDGGESLL